MMRKFVRLPSPAMAVSLAALFVALGGTSYAAFSLPNNSVGAKQLKHGAVTTSKIKNGAVTTSKLKNGAVTAAKINTAGLTVPSALHSTTADTATALPPLHWIPLTLINGWTDYNGAGDARSPAIAVDAQGIVHFRGAISNPSSTANEQFAQLPTQFRTSQDVWLATDMFAATTGRIDLYTNGAAYAQPTGGTEANATGFTNLDGITYSLG